MLRVEPPARGGGCDGVAAQYRDIQGIHGLDGTAVTVMAMVYGNLGKTSGTGVLFRSPAAPRGRIRFARRRLLHGRRPRRRVTRRGAGGGQPQPVQRREQALRRVPHRRAGRGRGGGHPHPGPHQQAPDRHARGAAPHAPAAAPWRAGIAPGGPAGLLAADPSGCGQVYKDLLANVEKLEHHYKDMQARARRRAAASAQTTNAAWAGSGHRVHHPGGPPLHASGAPRRRRAALPAAPDGAAASQCRNGKRTGAAAIKVAVDLFKEGIITKDEAISKVPPPPAPRARRLS